MTLKNIYKLTSGRDKFSPKRRSGVLTPVVNNHQNEGSMKSVKSREDENTICQALITNEFLRNVLVTSSLKKLIQLVHLKKVPPGDLLLQQGYINSHLYISKSGRFEILENDKTTTVHGVNLFGEVALLHSTKACQTVKALTAGEVWVLDCGLYKSVIAQAHIERREEIVDFLKVVPGFRKAANDKLYGLCDLFQEKFYAGTKAIVMEGEVVEHFLLVTSGSATILTRDSSGLDNLTKGSFFGDYIFVKETVSLYTIIADPPGVECVVVSRRQFLDQFGSLDEFLYGKESDAFQHIELHNLKLLKTLGVGGFGRVELVQIKNKDDIFALKLMKKHEINGKAQIDQVFNEKELQLACNSEFIVRLYKTFRDSKYIYFLLEPCLGGDLWNLLRRQRRKCFDTDTAKFYAGCILEALSYLHAKDIVYRDLKPENVMLSSSGYLKLTDFGFAKKLPPNETSYSFVGTAEYVAPELIQNLPHDKGVDYWALGIFIFELLVGKSPFRNEEHSDLKTYKAILKGIDFVAFPYIVSPRARNLIKKLCRPLSVDRLGCLKNGVADIQTHPWFAKFEWDKLRSLKLEPPIRISLNGKTDTRYFETFKEEIEDVLDDFSTWDKDF